MKIKLKFPLTILFYFFTVYNILASGQEVNSRIIYLIHGDGNYVFHDSRGNSINADENILNEAHNVAQQLKNGEVFIYHQKKKEMSFFFFPEDDGDYFHYRNGILLNSGSYSRENSIAFEAEAEIFSRYRSEVSVENLTSVLLYYGHEIPVNEKAAYNSSYPDKNFDLSEFEEGIKNLSGESFKFDLIVLSTCNNGTIYSIKPLAPYAKFILASPGELHLSYISSEFLSSLSGRIKEDIHSFARNFASEAFKKLSKSTNTEITISLFNSEKLLAHQNEVISAEELGTFVDILYRPALFGKKKSQSLTGSK
jgi:hypothetical protein